MKLSNIKGERTLDVIADIIEPIANIANDEEATSLFKKEKTPEGITAKKFLVERIKKSVPILLKEHKQDIISILAAIEGKKQEQYKEELNLVKLTKDCIDLLNDPVFIELFISAQNGDSSGSAQANTEDS